MIAPMLSRPVEQLPSGRAYLFEIKLDGQRTLAEVSNKKLLLYTRTFQNVTGRYPELEEISRCFQGKSAVFDGEIVALDRGIPSFQLLQRRMSLRDTRALRPAQQKVPIFYYIFDLLHLNGKSLLRTPLAERKKRLQKVLRSGEHIRLMPVFDSSELIVEKARAFGYEGIVAKRRDSAYLPGRRTALWLKQKFQSTDSFVIGGWLEGGRSHHFGSLLVGKYCGKELVYCGRVGTGFDEACISVFMQQFGRISSQRCPFKHTPQIKGARHWLKPEMVAEVRFKELTQARMLRSAVFLGLRPDVSRQDCRL